MGAYSHFSPLLCLLVSFQSVTQFLLPAVCGVGILICSNGAACVNMSSNCPTAFSYCSIVLWVLHTCFMFHVMSLPVFMTYMMYDCPLCGYCLLSLISSITQCIQGPLSPYCTAAIDPMEKLRSLCEYHCP